MDKVIVLMATYQGEKYLEGQLKSIMAQDYPNFELIVRDDASSDGTFFLLSLYKKRYPDKITVLRNKKNLGGTKNFLMLLRDSAARQSALGRNQVYFMFSDQDDYWYPNKISRTLSRMKRLEARHGEEMPALVFTDARVVDGEGKELAPSFYALQRFNMKKRTFSHLLMENMVIGCTSMLNMPLAEMLTKIPKEARYHDWWMALLAASAGHTSYLPEPTMDYRQHGDNVVGAQSFGAYVIKRIKELKRQRLVLLKTFGQATEFYHLYSLEIPDRAVEQLEGFLMLQAKNPLVCRLNAIRGGYLKSGLIRNIGLMMLF